MTRKRAQQFEHDSVNDWAVFREAVPWLLHDGGVAEVTDTRMGWALSCSVQTLFPPLDTLLAAASVTTVIVDGVRYELLAWDASRGDRMGWLCLPPSPEPPRNIHCDHRELLASFGGIVERFNEPEETWLLNLHDALTEREAVHDGSFIRHYDWAFEDAGLALPIEPTEYYSIAREASGNATLCHRNSGKVLMFAPDHCFEHLKELVGCPELTLYEINGVATFRDWVNAVALQWLAHIRRSG
jgi:hypothetical protein